MPPRKKAAKRKAPAEVAIEDEYPPEKKQCLKAKGKEFAENLFNRLYFLNSRLYDKNPCSANGENCRIAKLNRDYPAFFEAQLLAAMNKDREEMYSNLITTAAEDLCAAEKKSVLYYIEDAEQTQNVISLHGSSCCRGDDRIQIHGVRYCPIKNSFSIIGGDRVVCFSLKHSVERDLVKQFMERNLLEADQMLLEMKEKMQQEAQASFEAAAGANTQT